MTERTAARLAELRALIAAGLEGEYPEDFKQIQDADFEAVVPYVEVLDSRFTLFIYPARGDESWERFSLETGDKHNLDPNFGIKVGPHRWRGLFLTSLNPVAGNVHRAEGETPESLQAWVEQMVQK